jgi:hypothetical protein
VGIAGMYTTGTAQRGNMTANLWLLVMKSYTAPKQYLCRSDPNNTQVASPTTGNLYYNNFPTLGNFSYATALPWDTANNKIGFWKAIVDASTPLMADQPPKNGETIGTITIALNVVQTNPKQWNSQLHGGDGQSVGWSDAHASFERKPNIGYNNDNIWTNNAGSPTETGSAPAPTAFASGTSASTSGTVSSYSSGGAVQNWDIYMGPPRDKSGQTGALN